MFLFLTDIIIQLDSRTPPGSLTERDGDEKPSPRLWLAAVREINQEGEEYLLHLMDFFFLEILGANLAADQGGAVF